MKRKSVKMERNDKLENLWVVNVKKGIKRKSSQMERNEKPKNNEWTNEKWRKRKGSEAKSCKYKEWNKTDI